MPGNWVSACSTPILSQNRGVGSLLPRRATLVAVCALLLGPAHAVRAELVFLASGRALSVSGHRIEGRSVVLTLRSGGEVVCDASLVARIEPDEVAWPQQVPAAPALVVGGPAAEAPSATPYEELIQPIAARHGVEPALVRAIVDTESGFAPRARSPKGAMGLMQLMPVTARQYALANPFDPSANLETGVRHLKSLLGRYDMRSALAAYNAGEAAVRRFQGVPPFRETQDYVTRVLSRLEHYRRLGRTAPGAGLGPIRPGPSVPTS